MTLTGAIQQLHELRCAEDMPIYYKPAIAEVVNVLLMDAQELRRGHWKEDAAKIKDQCSVCGLSVNWSQYKTPYCPFCGAKMDEVEDDT